MQKILLTISIIKRQIFAPAIPCMAALYFAALVGVSDAYLAGKIGNSALAAMSFCEPLWFLVTLLTTGVCSGVTVGLASKCPPKQIKTTSAAQLFIADCLLLSAGVGVILLCSALLLATILFNHPLWLSGTAKIVAEYFLVCSLSNLPFAIMQTQCAIFRAASNSRSVIVVWGVASTIEIVLSNLLIASGFHELTAFAAAWTVACSLASAVGFALLKPLMPNFQIKTYSKNFLPASHFCTSTMCVLSVGLPVLLGELGLLCGSISNLYVLSILPDAQKLEAAWTIKSRLEEVFVIVPISAIALTMAPFISWHRHKIDSKTLAANIALQSAFVFGLLQLLIAVVLQCAAHLISRLFNVDAASVELTAQTISLTAFAFPFFAIACILAAALEGIQKAMQVTVVSVIINLPVRAAIILAFKDCGMTGVAIANVLTQVLIAIAVFVIFKRAFASSKCPDWLVV